MAQGVKANIEKEELATLLQTFTVKEIAEQLNVSVTTVKRYKAKYGLSANSLLTKAKNSEAHRKYDCDQFYFDTIDTLDKAYLLGFICADGFITKQNEVGIEVATKDKDIVLFFQQQLKSNKPVTTKQNLGTGSVGLRIQNYYLADSLKKYGVIPNKSLVLNIKEVIEKSSLNEKQISVFLLGYFDGDGCISLAHNRKTNKEYFEMNVTGTKETIDYYKQYFNNHGTITKRHKDDKNNFTLQMSNNFLTIYNALSKIYQYSNELSFHLQRKFLLFKQLEAKVKS